MKRKPFNLKKTAYLVLCTLFIVTAILCYVNPDIHAFVLGSQGDSMLAASPIITVFSKDVEQNLAPDNSFYLDSIDESANLDGKTVRNNVSADDPESVTDPTSFPLAVQENEEDSNDYDIALHATKPERIADVDSYIFNYDKRKLVSDRHTRVLNNKIAIEMAYCWTPTLATNYTRTSGADVAAMLTDKGATGNRKAITKNDWIEVSRLLDRMDAPSNDRRALIDANTYAIMLKIADFIDYDKTGRSDMLSKGFIGEICGIKLRKRSVGALYTTAVAKKKIDATIATTDNAATLIWSASMVKRAIGPVETYYNPKQGTMLGSTLNFAVRAGGNTRKDQKGVVAIIETT